VGRSSEAEAAATWGPRPLARQQTARRGRLERAKQAALELAGEGGYDAVTMPKVALRSGVSRANLYQHFVSKDHLIAAAFGETAEERIGKPVGASVTAPTAGERVLAYFDQAIERSQANPQLIDAYVRAYARAPNEVIEAIPNVFAARLEEVLGPKIRNRSEIALVLELVYSTLITAVVGRGAPVDRMRADLRTAVAVVLGKR
jgi:TetR/AcrR family transcriptional regulator, cholesterol catabolism regulator